MDEETAAGAVDTRRLLEIAKRSRQRKRSKTGRYRVLETPRGHENFISSSITKRFERISVRHQDLGLTSSKQSSNEVVESLISSRPRSFAGRVPSLSEYASTQQPEKQNLVPSPVKEQVVPPPLALQQIKTSPIKTSYSRPRIISDEQKVSPKAPKILTRSPRTTVFEAIRKDRAKEHIKKHHPPRRKKYERNFERGAPIVHGQTDIQLHVQHFDANHGERYALFHKAYRRSESKRSLRKASSAKMPSLAPTLSEGKESPPENNVNIGPNSPRSQDTAVKQVNIDDINNMDFSFSPRGDDLLSSPRPTSARLVTMTEHTEEKASGKSGYDKMTEEEACIFKFLQHCKTEGIVASKSMIKLLLPGQNNGEMKLTGKVSGGASLHSLAKILAIDEESPATHHGRKQTKTVSPLRRAVANRRHTDSSHRGSLQGLKRSSSASARTPTVESSAKETLFGVGDDASDVAATGTKRRPASASVSVQRLSEKGAHETLSQKPTLMPLEAGVESVPWNKKDDESLRNTVLGAVKTLTIHDHRLQKQSCGIICNLISHGSQLCTIDLRIKSLGSMDLKAKFASIRWPTTVTKLLLQQCGLKDGAVDGLCASTISSHLLVLDVSQNRLTDASASKISECFLEREDSILEALICSENHFTAQCLTYFARGLNVGATKLHTLGLAKNHLVGVGIMTSSVEERGLKIENGGESEANNNNLAWRSTLNPNDDNPLDNTQQQRLLNEMTVPNKLLKIYTEIARIYERKVHADMVNDGLHNARDELSTFVQNHYRTKFGIEKIAVQRLQELHDDTLHLIGKSDQHNFISANCVVRLYWFAVLCGWIAFQPKPPEKSPMMIESTDTAQVTSDLKNVEQLKLRKSPVSSEAILTPRSTFTDGSQHTDTGPKPHMLPPGTKFFAMNFLLDCFKFLMPMTFIDETIRKVPVYVELDRVIGLILNPAARGNSKEIGGCFLKHKGTAAINDLIARLDRSSIQIASFQQGVITQTVEEQAHLKTSTKWVVLFEDAMDALLRAWLHLREEGITVHVGRTGAGVGRQGSSSSEDAVEDWESLHGGGKKTQVSDKADSNALLPSGLGDRQMFSSKDQFIMGLVNNTALRFLDLSNCDLTGKDSTFIRMLLMSSKSLISVKLEGNGLRVERDSAHVHAVIHKATASTMTPHQRRVQSAMRRKKQRHSLDESSHDDTIANLDHAFESPDVETRFVCRHDPELPHSRQNPATTPSGTPSSSPAGSQASTPSGSPIGSPSISPSISPLGSPRAESAVLTTSAANAAELEKKRQARLQRQIAREHGMWQKQSPFQMRQWIPTNVCWYTAFVQHSNESKERKTSRTQPRSSQNSPPQRTSAKFLGSVSENVSPVQNSALADSAAQPVMVPVKFVYVPRILGPDFVEKLELLVWSDDKRWCDKAGNPWSNHCLFKRGGHHENGGAMTYHDRCVMDKVHRILLACSKLQWRFRRTALIRKYTRSGGDIFEAYRAFLTKQLNGGENREPPFFTACACPETALVTQRYDKPTAPTGKSRRRSKKSPNFVRYRVTTGNIMRNATSKPMEDFLNSDESGAESSFHRSEGAREQVRAEETAKAREADVAMIAYMLNVGEDPNQIYHMDNSTPLFRAVTAKNLDAVKLLVEARANVNHRNITKRTPLHYAYKYGCFNIALYLLLHGANDFVLSHSGRRPSELDLELHRRVLAKLHGVRRSHIAALDRISRRTKEEHEQEKRGASESQEIFAHSSEAAAATFAQRHGRQHADGASLSALHAVDLRGSDVIERILLCPRGKIFFHFFVDGHPVLLSHVPSEHCGRRTYNNGAHHVSVANTAYVAPPSSRTATPGAILSIGGSSANVLGIINHCSVGTVLEKWLEDLLLAAQTRPKAPEQKTEVVVQEEPQKPSRRKSKNTYSRLVILLERDMELHHSIAVASAEQKPRPRKLERKSSFNKKSSPTRSASRRRRRSVTHTVVELSSQHPVFVAKVERVHQLQHNSNTTPGFFKKYFQREEVEMCMDVSLQKAGLHSRAGRSQDRVGHQGEFTHIESKPGRRFAGIAHIVHATRNNPNGTEANAVAMSLNARFYSLAVRMIYLGKLAVREALERAQKNYVPPKFVSDQDQARGSSLRNGSRSPTAKTAVKAARLAHHESQLAENHCEHDGKFLPQWIQHICFQPDKEEFKEFLRWLGKFIIRTNPSLQSKEQKKRQKSTESDDDNANKFKLPPIEQECSVARVQLLNETEKYARRIQISHPLVVKFEVRSDKLIVKASITHDDIGASPKEAVEETSDKQ